MIHIYDIPQQVPSLQGTQPSHSAEAKLEPSFSLETNALTHCKLSILDLGQGEAWIAVPAVLEDDKVSAALAVRSPWQWLRYENRWMYCICHRARECVARSELELGRRTTRLVRSLRRAGDELETDPI